mmetsp:Transcript_6717/g.16503  ORF Transcript_6717/g.16503 Transcript_6717/m.16503 type:complete len:121 (-) Transcript_6717:25-387(-)
MGSAQVVLPRLHYTWASEELFQHFVLIPSTNEDPCDSFCEIEIAEMPRCLGSANACHIEMLNCHYQLRIHNSGFKISMPTRTFNLTVKYYRKILSTITGHLGWWNDKHLVSFDKFVMNIK